MIDERVRVELTVNGTPRAAEVAPGRTLLDMLRWELDLTGSKECCAEGECGACTVHLNGEPVNSCLILAVEANGADLTTIEGLGGEGRLSPLQDAFLETGAVQCGFCIPGMVMAAEALLRENAHPTMLEVREGLSGNLCRCAGYTRICDAVLRVADGRRAAGDEVGGEAVPRGDGRDRPTPGSVSPDAGNVWRRPDGVGDANARPGLDAGSSARVDPGSSQDPEPGNRRFPASSASGSMPSNRRFDPSSSQDPEPGNRRFPASSARRAEP